MRFSVRMGATSPDAAVAGATVRRSPATSLSCHVQLLSRMGSRGADELTPIFTQRIGPQSVRRTRSGGSGRPTRAR